MGQAKIAAKAIDIFENRRLVTRIDLVKNAAIVVIAAFWSSGSAPHITIQRSRVNPLTNDLDLLQITCIRFSILPLTTC
jgi:hypothetical protein